MPRPYMLADVLALLDAVDTYSNGLPRSVIVRRCQPVVNHCVTRTACDRARSAFADRRIITHLPARFERRELALAQFEVNELPLLRNVITNLGTFLPFIPDLLPKAMLESARLWSRYEGGESPAVLAKKCRRAAARYLAAHPAPNGPLWPATVLAFRDGKILGSITPPRAYALR